MSVSLAKKVLCWSVLQYLTWLHTYMTGPFFFTQIALFCAGLSSMWGMSDDVWLLRENSRHDSWFSWNKAYALYHDMRQCKNGAGMQLRMIQKVPGIGLRVIPANRHGKIALFVGAWLTICLKTRHGKIAARSQKACRTCKSSQICADNCGPRISDSCSVFSVLTAVHKSRSRLCFCSV